MKSKNHLGVLMTMNLIVVSALADAAANPAEQCEVLKTADFSTVQDAPTQITQVKFAEAKNGSPAFCQVQGYVTPQVGFEIRLPVTNWNKKFLKVGCGGMCGQLWSERGVCDAPLQRGYACIVSDMGHKGSDVMDGVWAYNNLQAELDFGYRATHVAALAGKAIVERYYRAAAQRSYYMGCSTGGRQGLVEAQRFPWDFDGILVGAPPTDQAALLAYLVAAAKAARGSNGDAVLPSAALELLHERAMEKCDLDDGVKDRIIGHPSACRLNPAALLCKPAQGPTQGCLTEQQVAVASAIYAGASLSTGDKLHPGAAVGSERNWSSFAGWMGEHAAHILRYLYFVPDAGPAYTLSDFDLDRDYKRLGMMESLYSASNPDLRRFKAAGGKLIMYQGWNDAWTVPGKNIEYYETVERTMGGRRPTQEFFRLFLLPGVDHCAGGNGADAVDFLSHLENWVEQGQAPDRIISAHLQEQPATIAYPYRTFPEGSAVKFTRPVFPYPQRAIYKGSGDPNDAANFRAIEP